MKREEEEESAGDWTQSLHTQLKESSAQRRRLATCVLTFVSLSVVIYRTAELKAKLAADQHWRPGQWRRLGEGCQIGSGGQRAAVLFSSARTCAGWPGPCC